MIKRYLLVLCALCLATTAQAQAQAPTENVAAKLVKAMQQRYETLTSFEGDFTQELKNSQSGETSKRSGHVWYRRPMEIRWENKTPEPELLVIGIQGVWSWFELEETAYRYTVEQVLDSKTMLRFLSGQARLDEDFYVTSQGVEDGLEKLELIPREAETSLVQAYLWLDPEQNVLRKLLIIDFFGNENLVALDNLKLDSKPGDEMFNFTPPKGADVFDNTKGESLDLSQ